MTGTLASGIHLQNGKYVTISVFGQGYFSITYLAANPALNKQVIIHEFFLQDHCTRDQDNRVSHGSLDESIYLKFREQWFEEAKVLARCSRNEHIVTVLDTFGENDTLYFVTEYINEETLFSYTLSIGEKRLPGHEAAEIIGQLADGLSLLHQHSVYHRALCPKNILISRSRKAVLINFGIAQNEIPKEILADPSRLKKPGYSSPEMYLSPGNEICSDIYSLGAILHFLVTGEDPQPVTGDSRTWLPGTGRYPAGVSEKLVRVIRRSMKEVPEERYRNIRELLADMPDPGNLSERKRKQFGMFAFVLKITGVILLIVAGLLVGKRCSGNVARDDKMIKAISGLADQKCRGGQPERHLPGITVTPFASRIFPNVLASDSDPSYMPQ